MVLTKDYHAFTTLHIIIRFQCMANETCIFVALKTAFGSLYRDYVFIKPVEVIGVLAAAFLLQLVSLFLILCYFVLLLYILCLEINIFSL